MNINIPTNHALDKMLELFFDNLGIDDTMVKEDIVIDAFYTGAKSMLLISQLQEAESEEDIETLLTEGYGSVDEINTVLMTSTFDEANFEEGES